MRIFDVIKLAFKNLFRRKARTVLTLLGIVVGSVSVIIMISIGLGLDQSKQELLSQFTSLEKITVYRRYDYDESMSLTMRLLNHSNRSRTLKPLHL